VGNHDAKTSGVGFVQVPEAHPGITRFRMTQIQTLARVAGIAREKQSSDGEETDPRRAITVEGGFQKGTYIPPLALPPAFPSRTRPARTIAVAIV
jgi:hypothetical protein